MNARILFATTLVVALASSFAIAGEAKPLSRADVVAELQKARVDGTLRKNDYDYDAHDIGTGAGRSRAAVIAEMGTPRDPLLVGFTARSRSYNPYGSELLRMSTVPRAQVKTEVLTAMREGTLRRSDYDDIPVRALRRTVESAAAPILAGTGTGVVAAR